MRSLIFFFVVLITILGSSDCQSIGDDSCSATEAYLHEGFYYQMFDCPMSWNEAERTCATRMTFQGEFINDGHLVSILDADEAAYLQFHVNLRYGRQIGIWIGLQRTWRQQRDCPRRNSVPRRWTDGNNVFQGSWQDPDSEVWIRPLSPDCNRNERCFYFMDSRQRWDDAECESQMRFICKAPGLDFTPSDDNRPTERPSGDETDTSTEDDHSVRTTETTKIARTSTTTSSTTTATTETSTKASTTSIQSSSTNNDDGSGSSSRRMTTTTTGQPPVTDGGDEPPPPPPPDAPPQRDR